eukprot:1161394-Pelagomonas_calceolata.AAC.10
MYCMPTDVRQAFQGSHPALQPSMFLCNNLFLSNRVEKFLSKRCPADLPRQPPSPPALNGSLQQLLSFQQSRKVSFQEMPGRLTKAATQPSSPQCFFAATSFFPTESKSSFPTYAWQTYQGSHPALQPSINSKCEGKETEAQCQDGGTKQVQSSV